VTPSMKNCEFFEEGAECVRFFCPHDMLPVCGASCDNHKYDCLDECDYVEGKCHGTLS